MSLTHIGTCSSSFFHFFVFFLFIGQLRGHVIKSASRGYRMVLIHHLASSCLSRPALAIKVVSANEGSSSSCVSSAFTASFHLLSCWCFFVLSSPRLVVLALLLRPSSPRLFVLALLLRPSSPLLVVLALLLRPSSPRLVVLALLKSSSSPRLVMLALLRLPASPRLVVQALLQIVLLLLDWLYWRFFFVFFLDWLCWRFFVVLRLLYRHRCIFCSSFFSSANFSTFIFDGESFVDEFSFEPSSSTPSFCIRSSRYSNHGAVVAISRSFSTISSSLKLIFLCFPSKNWVVIL